MPKTAILLGASGATGGELLKLLLADNRYSKIKIFLRSSINNSHPKLEKHVIDMFKLEDYGDAFKADDVFCCIGTTKAKTPDKETYYKIDYGIPAAAAKLAKANAVSNFIVVSAIGANKNSSIFYNRTKGEMQEMVLAQNISNTHIMQPSLIVANRKEARIMEKIAAGFMQLINPLLVGSAEKYKSIKASAIAIAMLWLANNKYPEVIVTSDKIHSIANKNYN